MQRKPSLPTLTEQFQFFNQPHQILEDEPQTKFRIKDALLATIQAYLGEQNISPTNRDKLQSIKQLLLLRGKKGRQRANAYQEILPTLSDREALILIYSQINYLCEKPHQIKENKLLDLSDSHTLIRDFIKALNKLFNVNSESELHYMVCRYIGASENELAYAYRRQKNIVCTTAMAGGGAVGLTEETMKIEAYRSLAAEKLRPERANCCDNPVELTTYKRSTP